MEQNIIPFLRELAVNNTKEWFEANRAHYEAARNDLMSMVEALISKINKFDPSIGNPNPKDCIFRQHRDLRFSKNKQPYKSTMSAVIMRAGKKSPFSAYYLHLEPDNSFVGGGLHTPEPIWLKAVRNEIYFNLEEWKKIVSNKDFQQTFGTLRDENKLKRPPKGFPSDFVGIDFLKHKEFIVAKEFDPEKLNKLEMVDFVGDIFEIMYPMNAFINRAIEFSMDDLQ